MIPVHPSRDPTVTVVVASRADVHSCTNVWFTENPSTRRTTNTATITITGDRVLLLVLLQATATAVSQNATKLIIS